MKVDFPTLMSMPVALEEILRISSNVRKSLTEPEQNIKMSSMKSKCEMLRFCASCSPVKLPNLIASLRARLRPSATNRNKSGDNGKPCRSPRSAWKKGEAAPLIRTEKETVVKQLIIHMINAISKPRCVNRKRI